MTVGRPDILTQAILNNHTGNALHSQQGTTNERPSASAIDWAHGPHGNRPGTFVKIGAARQDPNNFNATSI